MFPVGCGGRSLSVRPRLPGQPRSFGTRQEQLLRPSPAPAAIPTTGLLPPHVHKAHGDQVRLQVREHHCVVSDLRGGDHRQLHVAQDHIQEQVYEERTQRPDWQPGIGGPALYHHRHPHQCVQGNHIHPMCQSDCVCFTHSLSRI